ncbi:MAG: hypothetical protein ACK5OB_10745 [Pirellula sp.]
MWTRKGWVVGLGLVVMGGIGSGVVHADPPRVRHPHHCAPHGYPVYGMPGTVITNRPILVTPYTYGVPSYNLGHPQRYGNFGGMPYGSYYRGYNGYGTGGFNGYGTGGWPVGPSYGGGGFPAGPSFGGSGWGISIYGR